MHAKVAILVGCKPLFGPLELRHNHDSRDRTAGDAAPHIAQLIEKALWVSRLGPLRLPEDSPDQKHLGPTPVTPVRLENESIPGLPTAHRAREHSEHVDECPLPIEQRFEDRHGSNHTDCGEETAQIWIALHSSYLP